jgi:hypothetical protein
VRLYQDVSVVARADVVFDQTGATDAHRRANEAVLAIYPLGKFQIEKIAGVKGREIVTLDVINMLRYGAGQND